MRFEVGEMAKFVVACTPKGVSLIGNIVEIIAIGPWPKGTICMNGRRLQGDADYSFRIGDRDYSCLDYQLQKLNPPEEPIAMTHHEEVEA